MVLWPGLLPHVLCELLVFVDFSWADDKRRSSADSYSCSEILGGIWNTLACAIL